MPRSANACIVSSQLLPVLTMPSRAGSPSARPNTLRSSRFARAQASAAGIFQRVSRSSSCGNVTSGQRMFKPPSGIGTFSGVTIDSRCGDTSTMPATSIVSVTAFSATHRPVKRDIAKPCSP